VDRPPTSPDDPDQPRESPRADLSLSGDQHGDQHDQHDQHDDQHDQHDQHDEPAEVPEDHTDQNAPPDDSEDADVTATTLTRPPLSPSARVLLERSRAGLLAAAATRTCSERYLAAHMAALRAAAAVLAVRGRPGSRGGPRSVWEVLPRIAPEMGEWAAFFAATASRRAAVEAGRGEVITAREADDLLRDAEAFHHVVEASFGLPYQQVLPGAFPACI
jgi:SAV_6107-like HEPN